MRILQLCKKFPFPLKDGESIAVNSLSKGLKESGCEITLLAMNTRKHYSTIPFNCPDLIHYKEVHHVYVDNTLNPIDALSNLISKRSYHLARFNNTAFRNKLIELLKNNNFDIVQLETSYMSMYTKVIEAHSNAKIVLRSHNLEYEIWQRIAANSKGGLKQWYLKNCAARLLEFEQKNLNSYDLLVSITKQDLKKYRDLGLTSMAIDSPAGLNIDEYKPKPSKRIRKIGFIGSLDWMPNVEGLVWFLEKVWPKVQSRNPKVKFYIAGRNIDSKISKYATESVIIAGEVKCSKSFIASSDLMVVPLFSGSGIRIKILESLAISKTVISTALGAEGIEYENGEHLLIADSEQQFLEAIQYCIEDPNMLEIFGKNGRNLIASKYDNKLNAEEIHSTYLDLLAETSPKKVNKYEDQ